MKIERLCRYGGMCVPVIAMLVGCGRSQPQSATPVTQISAITISTSRFEVTEDLPGRVAALRVAEIRAQVSGIVQRRIFEQGSEVHVGQPLFQINPAPFQAEVDITMATLKRAEAVLSRARMQAERLQPLIETDAVSRQAYDDAVSQRDQAAADVAQARATLVRRQLDLKFARVEAPIQGRIDQALVTEGALVSSSDSNPMARIQQIDQVYVDVRCPASSLEAMREASTKQRASFGNGLPVVVLGSSGAPYGVKGRILFSGISVDASTGDALLRVLVDNPQRQLLPGMFVRVRISHTSDPAALTVPQQAVIRVGGQPQVWVIDGNNRAHLKPIEIGELSGRYYRIRKGLSSGEKIAIEGMERLNNGTEVVAHDWKVAGSVPAAPVS